MKIPGRIVVDETAELGVKPRAQQGGQGRDGDARVQEGAPAGPKQPSGAAGGFAGRPGLDRSCDFAPGGDGARSLAVPRMCLGRAALTMR
jgi:hypothetical protein